MADLPPVSPGRVLDARSPLRPSTLVNVHAGVSPSSQRSSKRYANSPTKSAIKQGNLLLAAGLTDGSPALSQQRPAAASLAFLLHPDSSPASAESGAASQAPDRYLAHDTNFQQPTANPPVQSGHTPPALKPTQLASLPPTPFRCSPQPPPLTTLADLDLQTEANTPSPLTPASMALDPQSGADTPTALTPGLVTAIWDTLRLDLPIHMSPTPTTSASAPHSTATALPVAAVLPPTPYQHSPLPPPLTMLADLETGTPAGLTPPPCATFSSMFDGQGIPLMCSADQGCNTVGASANDSSPVQAAVSPFAQGSSSLLPATSPAISSPIAFGSPSLMAYVSPGQTASPVVPRVSSLPTMTGSAPNSKPGSPQPACSTEKTSTPSAFEAVSPAPTTLTSLTLLGTQTLQANSPDNRAATPEGATPVLQQPLSSYGLATPFQHSPQPPPLFTLADMDAAYLNSTTPATSPAAQPFPPASTSTAMPVSTPGYPTAQQPSTGSVATHPTAAMTDTAHTPPATVSTSEEMLITQPLVETVAIVAAETVAAESADDLVTIADQCPASKPSGMPQMSPCRTPSRLSRMTLPAVSPMLTALPQLPLYRTVSSLLSEPEAITVVLSSPTAITTLDPLSSIPVASPPAAAIAAVADAVSPNRSAQHEVLFPTSGTAGADEQLAAAPCPPDSPSRHTRSSSKLASPACKPTPKLIHTSAPGTSTKSAPPSASGAISIPGPVHGTIQTSMVAASNSPSPMRASDMPQTCVDVATSYNPSNDASVCESPAQAVLARGQPVRLSFDAFLPGLETAQVMPQPAATDEAAQLALSVAAVDTVPAQHLVFPAGLTSGGCSVDDKLRADSVSVTAEELHSTASFCEDVADQVVYSPVPCKAPASNGVSVAGTTAVHEELELGYTAYAASPATQSLPLSTAGRGTTQSVLCAAAAALAALQSPARSLAPDHAQRVPQSLFGEALAAVSEGEESESLDAVIDCGLQAEQQALEPEQIHVIDAVVEAQRVHSESLLDVAPTAEGLLNLGGLRSSQLPAFSAGQLAVSRTISADAGQATLGDEFDNSAVADQLQQYSQLQTTAAPAAASSLQVVALTPNVSKIQGATDLSPSHVISQACEISFGKVPLFSAGNTDGPQQSNNICAVESGMAASAADTSGLVTGSHAGRNHSSQAPPSPAVGCTPTSHAVRGQAAAPAPPHTTTSAPIRARTPAAEACKAGTPATAIAHRVLRRYTAATPCNAKVAPGVDAASVAAATFSPGSALHGMAEPASHSDPLEADAEEGSGAVPTQDTPATARPQRRASAATATTPVLYPGLVLAPFGTQLRAPESGKQASIASFAAASVGPKPTPQSLYMSTALPSPLTRTNPHALQAGSHAGTNVLCAATPGTEAGAVQAPLDTETFAIDQSFTIATCKTHDIARQGASVRDASSPVCQETAFLQPNLSQLTSMDCAVSTAKAVDMLKDKEVLPMLADSVSAAESVADAGASMLMPEAERYADEPLMTAATQAAAVSKPMTAPSTTAAVAHQVGVETLQHHNLLIHTQPSPALSAVPVVEAQQQKAQHVAAPMAGSGRQSLRKAEIALPSPQLSTAARSSRPTRASAHKDAETQLGQQTVDSSHETSMAEPPASVVSALRKGRTGRSMAAAATTAAAVVPSAAVPDLAAEPSEAPFDVAVKGARSRRTAAAISMATVADVGVASAIGEGEGAAYNGQVSRKRKAASPASTATGPSVACAPTFNTRASKRSAPPAPTPNPASSAAAAAVNPTAAMQVMPAGTAASIMAASAATLATSANPTSVGLPQPTASDVPRLRSRRHVVFADEAQSLELPGSQHTPHTAAPPSPTVSASASAAVGVHTRARPTTSLQGAVAMDANAVCAPPQANMLVDECLPLAGSTSRPKRVRRDVPSQSLPNAAEPAQTVTNHPNIASRRATRQDAAVTAAAVPEKQNLRKQTTAFAMLATILEVPATLDMTAQQPSASLPVHVLQPTFLTGLSLVEPAPTPSTSGRSTRAARSSSRAGPLPQTVSIHALATDIPGQLQQSASASKDPPATTNVESTPSFSTAGKTASSRLKRQAAASADPAEAASALLLATSCSIVMMTAATHEPAASTMSTRRGRSQLAAAADVVISAEVEETAVAVVETAVSETVVTGRGRGRAVAAASVEGRRPATASQGTVTLPVDNLRAQRTAQASLGQDPVLCSSPPSQASTRSAAGGRRLRGGKAEALVPASAPAAAAVVLVTFVQAPALLAQGSSAPDVVGMKRASRRAAIAELSEAVAAEQQPATKRRRV